MSGDRRKGGSLPTLIFPQPGRQGGGLGGGHTSYLSLKQGGGDGEFKEEEEGHPDWHFAFPSILTVAP